MGQVTQFIKVPTTAVEGGQVYTSATIAQRGPSPLSNALASALLAQGLIQQQVATLMSSARGGFPPWEGGREIRRHIAL